LVKQLNTWPKYTGTYTLPYIYSQVRMYTFS